MMTHFCIVLLEIQFVYFGIDDTYTVDSTSLHICGKAFDY